MSGSLLYGSDMNLRLFELARIVLAHVAHVALLLVEAQHDLASPDAAYLVCALTLQVPSPTDLHFGSPVSAGSPFWISRLRRISILDLPSPTDLRFGDPSVNFAFRYGLHYSVAAEKLLLLP